MFSPYKDEPGSSKHCQLKDVFDEVETINFNYKQGLSKEIFKNCQHVDGTFFIKQKQFSIAGWEKLAMPHVLIIVPKKFLNLREVGNGFYELENWDWKKRGYGYNVPYYFLTPDGDKTRNVDEALVVYRVIGERESRIDDRQFNLIFKCPSDYFIEDSHILYEAQEWLEKNHPLPRKGISKKTRLLVYEMFNHHCAYCGEEITLSELRVDHIQSFMNNKGADDISNFYPACDVCNRVKSDRTLDRFKEAIRHCGEIHRKRKHPIMADSDKIAIKYGLTQEDHEITFFYEKENKDEHK